MFAQRSKYPPIEAPAANEAFGKGLRLSKCSVGNEPRQPQRSTSSANCTVRSQHHVQLHTLPIGIEVCALELNAL